MALITDGFVGQDTVSQWVFEPQVQNAIDNKNC
jgi:hypothetical protein